MLHRVGSAGDVRRGAQRVVPVLAQGRGLQWAVPVLAQGRGFAVGGADVAQAAKHRSLHALLESGEGARSGGCLLQKHLVNWKAVSKAKLRAAPAPSPAHCCGFTITFSCF